MYVTKAISINTDINYAILIKSLIYFLLICNFFFYIYDDWHTAQQTLTDKSTLIDWLAAFRTSLDETAWFVLLLFFELETYLLNEQWFTPWKTRCLHAIRWLCYLFIAHNVFANWSAVANLMPTEVSEITHLCQTSQQALAYSNYYEVTPISPANCNEMNTSSEYFFINDSTTLTDKNSLALARYMSWLDLFESISWIAILLCIELIMKLQDRGITSGKRYRLLNTAKLCFYTYLWICIAHWLYLGGLHYIYAWDEFVWIIGFKVIDMNMKEWKEDIDQHEKSPVI